MSCLKAICRSPWSSHISKYKNISHCMFPVSNNDQQSKPDINTFVCPGKSGNDWRCKQYEVLTQEPDHKTSTPTERISSSVTNTKPGSGTTNQIAESLPYHHHNTRHQHQTPTPPRQPTLPQTTNFAKETILISPIM